MPMQLFSSRGVVKAGRGAAVLVRAAADGEQNWGAGGPQRVGDALTTCGRDCGNGVAA